MIIKEPIIECDTCSAEFRNGATVKEIRRNAKKEGWKYQKGTVDLPSQTHIYGDYCPWCLEGAK